LPDELNYTDDLALFALIKQGDNRAFEHIYNKYWPDLFKTAHKRLNDKDKCQDILQNVFTDLWNRRQDLEILDLPAYLHTAVRFQALKIISQSSSKSSFIDIFETDIVSGLRSDEMLLDKEARKVIELFIKALPSKRRQIFVLYYFNELSTAQIATETGVSRKTVQNQLATASHALRLRLTHIFSYLVFIFMLHHR